MPLVCERFATSKLQKYEDLEEVSTFGFRGEALASISHVSHLSIITKTESSQCAYKAKYEDGKMLNGIEMCAGKRGTIISVEDLFYNVPTRSNVMKNSNDEYKLILEIMTNYSIYYSNNGIGFDCKKVCILFIYLLIVRF